MDCRTGILPRPEGLKKENGRGTPTTTKFNKQH